MASSPFEELCNFCRQLPRPSPKPLSPEWNARSLRPLAFDITSPNFLRQGFCVKHLLVAASNFLRKTKETFKKFWPQYRRVRQKGSF